MPALKVSADSLWSKFKPDADGSLLVNTEAPVLTRIDTVSKTLKYIGRAVEQNTQTNEAKWQIRRESIIGRETIIEYANNGEYDCVWDDRASLFPEINIESNNYLEFDGVNEHVLLGDNYDFGPAKSFSWSFWIYPDNLNAHRKMVAKTTTDVNVYGYSIGHSNSGTIFMQVRAPGALRNLFGTTQLTSGEWNHVVVTYDGSSDASGFTFYINNQKDPQAFSGSLNNWDVSDNLIFGSRGNTQYYSGGMKQVSVWDKELNTSEVEELYNDGVPTNLSEFSATDKLLSWWKMDTASNYPIEVDVIGNVNGTLTNMESSDYKVVI